MNPIDDELYQRLEVGSRATHDEIVRAYRRLARGAHPDAHPEDPDASRRFRELTEAYDVLANPARRASYDWTRRGVSAQPNADLASGTLGPPVPASPVSFFPGAATLRAGPVRVDPDPSSQAASSAGVAEPVDTVLVRLLPRLLDDRWLW